MDFFDHQERARRNTGRLVLLFGLAVLLILAGVNVAVALVLGSQGGLYPVEVALLVTLATLVLIGGGSLYRMARLKGGGRIVAEELGGRRVLRERATPHEQRLLNVVEEMAIASGVPVPAVYLLDQEPGINAFAAGWSPTDAVVGVTRGALEQLDRDELQGVIAHEFSHILHGDMRLNVRLMGILHGILLLGLIGQMVLRSLRFSGRSSKRGGQGTALVLGIGIALLVLGYGGTFFGQLIKAAVSRQREFLADSAAVQYTRNPLGIAGALMRIGGLKEGSALQHPRANEASHMFFGAGVGTLFGRLHATHPPLEERVVRIVPQLKGRLERARAGDRAAAASLQRGASGLAQEFPQLAASAALPPPAPSALQQAGAPSAEHLELARSLVGRIPPRLAAAAREPHGARALIYALLLDERSEVRAHQREALASATPAGFLAELDRLYPIVAGLRRELRVPLVDLALPALAELTDSQHLSLLRDLDALVEADRRVTLEELTVRRLVRQQLDPLHHGGLAPGPRREGRVALTELAEPARLLLSALAREGAEDEAAAARAFAAGWERTRLGAAAPLPAGDLDGRALDRALQALSELAPLERRRLLEAAAAAVEHDGVVRPVEAELFRLVAGALRCPVPPLLAGQRLA